VSREGTAFLDLLIGALMEHEKTLDTLANKLEKIVLSLEKIAKERKKAGDEPERDIDDFTDRVCEHLMRLPKGLNFSILKVTHTAYVKITETELNHMRDSSE